MNAWNLLYWVVWKNVLSLNYVLQQKVAGNDSGATGKVKPQTFFPFFYLLKITSLGEASRSVCPILSALVWCLFELWWQPHHPVATTSAVSLHELGTKGYFFFPSKPGAWLCHLCPSLPILWRIVNSHYIKLNGFLPCLLSITSFHCKRVISICSHPIQQIASHLVAQTAWPQASHPAAGGPSIIQEGRIQTASA